jgi:hypothetical protein
VATLAFARLPFQAHFGWSCFQRPLCVTFSGLGDIKFLGYTLVERSEPSSLATEPTASFNSVSLRDHRNTLVVATMAIATLLCLTLLFHETC